MTNSLGWMLAGAVVLGCGAEPNAEWGENLGTVSQAIAACAAGATTCEIESSAATNHGDPSVPGSLAYRLANHQTFPHDVYLLKPGTYYVDRTVTVPPGVTLRATGLEDVRVKAHPAFDNGTAMFRLSDASRLEKVAADGDSHPGFIVDARSTTGANVTGCSLRETSLVRSAHVVLADMSKNFAIRDSAISLAGIAADKTEPTSGEFQGSGVNCFHCRDLVVMDSTINYTRTAGIFMAGTLGAHIARNEIYEISWNTRASPNPPDYWRSGDGITAYHNNSNPFQANFTIHDNKIWLFYNHGIHVSGSGISITGNYIDGQADQARAMGHSAIYFVDGGDSFPGSACSKNVTIAYNELYRGRSPHLATATKEIVRVNYEPLTFHITDNTGWSTSRSGGDTICSGNLASSPSPPPLVPKLYYEFRQGVGVDTMGLAGASTHNGAGTVVDEVLGRVLRLDGQDDHLRVADDAVFDSDKFTITALVKPTDRSRTMQIFSKDQCNSSACSQRAWQFRLLSGGRLELIVFNAAGQNASAISALDTVPAGSWSFVAGSYDGSTIRIFHAPLAPLTQRQAPVLELLPSVSFAGPLARSSNAAFIGRSENANTSHFFGRIDDVTFFHEALTPAQFGEIINYGHMRVPDNELL